MLRGVAATTAALLTLSTVAYGVAKSDLAIGWVDGFFGINDRTIYEDRVTEVPGYTIPGATEGYSYLKGKQYETTYESADKYATALKEHAIKQGEEGFALLKNDNDALPLNKSTAGKKVALFGWNAYNTSDMKEHAFVCAYKNIGPSQVVNNEVADPGENSGREPEPIFDTIINSNPKRLYILLGTNALVRNDDAAEQSYLAYYSQMLDKFREALGSEVDIYVQSVTPVRPGVKQPGLYRERIQRVNSELAKMAVEKGCYFINLHEVLADENGDLRADLAAQDGVHLNASAYPLVRDYLTTHTAYNPENPYLEGSPYYKAAE